MAMKKAAPKKATSVKRGSSDSETLEQYKARLKLAEYQRGTHPRSAMGMGSGKGNTGFVAGYEYAKKAMENNAPSSMQGVDKKGRKTNIVGFYGGTQIDAKKKKKK